MSRLDAEIVKRNISSGRERAKELIKNGDISVNGKIIQKPSAEVSDSDEIISLAEVFKYVGRGGLKLEKAIDEFGLSISGKKCIDIGASTGGFTDCMLQNGAKIVYAVDVGHGQLAKKLCDDIRVVNAEATDIRNIDCTFTDGEVDFISVDVSFISVKMILPKAAELLKTGGELALLIKPQFEAGRGNIGKNGIVKNKKVHENVLADITSFAISIGFSPEKIIYSPIKGGSGNIEYLAYLKKNEPHTNNFNFKGIVEAAFKEL